MKIDSPLFTVIMTTYNRRDLLPRAISSVLEQTFSDFELLVIDNGATDDTPWIVKKIEDKRLEYILNLEPTTSCDSPRNIGIKRAKAPYITFLDDDDIWYPERLEKVKKAFDENPDVSAVCHNENIRLNGRINGIMQYGPWTDNFFEVLLYEKNCLSPSATTMKTELLRELNGFDLRKEFSAVADYDLWLRFAAIDAKVFFIEESLGEFSLTGHNWSIVNPVYDARVLNVVKSHMLAYEKKSVYNVSEKGMCRLFQLYCISANSFLKANNYMTAIRNYCNALLFVVVKPGILSYIYLKVKQKLLKSQSA